MKRVSSGDGGLHPVAQQALVNAGRPYAPGKKRPASFTIVEPDVLPQVIRVPACDAADHAFEARGIGESRSPRIDQRYAAYINDTHKVLQELLLRWRVVSHEVPYLVNRNSVRGDRGSPHDVIDGDDVQHGGRSPLDAEFASCRVVPRVRHQPDELPQAVRGGGAVGITSRPYDNGRPEHDELHPGAPCRAADRQLARELRPFVGIVELLANVIFVLEHRASAGTADERRREMDPPDRTRTVGEQTQKTNGTGDVPPGECGCIVRDEAGVAGAMKTTSTSAASCRKTSGARPQWDCAKSPPTTVIDASPPCAWIARLTRIVGVAAPWGRAIPMTRQPASAKRGKR